MWVVNPETIFESKKAVNILKNKYHAEINLKQSWKVQNFKVILKLWILNIEFYTFEFYTVKGVIQILS